MSALDGVDDTQLSISMGSDDYDLAFNPFADEDDADRSRAYYSSALHPKLHDHLKPTVRRRKSSGGDAGPSNAASRKGQRHTRSHTEIYVGKSGSGAHPLKSAGVNGRLHDVEATRPHLSRLVKTGTLVDAPPMDHSDEVASPTSSLAAEEKDVLVHEVTDKDSLAGVSLKYGIPMAELRRANHLWASDPIHLRKTLYIPIDKASRAKEFLPETSLISFTPDADNGITNPFDSVNQDGTEQQDKPIRQMPPSKTGTLRRIPASQLSFFPPPSAASKYGSMSKGTSVPFDESSRPVTKSNLGHGRYASSPASNSLTSILTALPIAASTRDDIIARLSLDSVSSSYSDSQRSGSEHDEGHELDDVTRRNHRSAALIEEEHESDTDSIYLQSMRTPRASQYAPRLDTERRHQHPASSTGTQQPSRRPLSSTSPPLSYIPQSQNHSLVRTVQPEPSPVMRLPSARSTIIGQSSKPSSASIANSEGISKSRGKRSVMDVDFGVEMGRRHADVSS
ncbi:hypothetical protein BDQ12DRAFT_672710 [Crucibulum laeve]|uniref:LysM domain-containing protein n=1 Tax=Crucibulum laeve TaxID=68775 RepID=A0A5C3MFV1_9AGAR|nr:hypothetical protein BDQ12DRAFT_672710 [Crucibulum laeve]